MHKSSKIWWGRRFLKVLDGFAEAGSRPAGRPYLNGQRIAGWSVNAGRVEAQIRDQPGPYYGVQETPVSVAWLECAPIPHAAWDKALALIGSRAGYISRLLFNEMPDEIEQPLMALGVSLLPARREELTSGCTCGVLPGTNCPHFLMLCHLLAGRLDQDPFLLFELRGLSRAELIERLQATPLGAALASALDQAPPPPQAAESLFTRPMPKPIPEAVDPRQFWRGQRKLPPGVEWPSPAAVSGILIRKGGDYPPFWDKDESFVEVMDEFYAQVRKKCKDWL